jgi:hypothetical protein
MMKLTGIQASLDAERSVAGGRLRPGVLEHLVQPVHLGGCGPGSALALTSQVAQLAARPLEQEAAQQPVGQDLSDPPDVDHVGLTARGVLEMRGVDQQHLSPVVPQYGHR